MTLDYKTSHKKKKRAAYIYMFIQTPLSSFRFIRLGLKRWIHLLNCTQEGWSATAQRWSNRSIAGSYIRSYEIKRLLDNKIFVDNFFIVDVVDNVD